MDVKLRYSYTLRDIARKISYKRHIVIQRVFKKFMEKVIIKIVTDGFRFKMPYNTGSLYLIATKEPALNIKETIRQKKRIYYNNDDSMGYSYKLRWELPFNMPNKNVNDYRISESATKVVSKTIRELKENRRLPVAFETRDEY